MKIDKDPFEDYVFSVLNLKITS